MQHTLGPATEYEKCDRLGNGAYGTVFKVRHVQTNTFYAMKRVKIAANARRMPKMPRHQTREIAALKALQHCHQHPNIVRLDDFVLDENSGQRHIALELCTMALAELIKTAYEECCEDTAASGDCVGIGRSETLALMRDITAGLAHCHARELMHRDLKPQNVLLCADGHAKLCDFGMACGVAFKRPLTPQMITRWYRAPEVLLGSRHYGMAVDIWALGCIVYEMCWLCPPFMGQTEMEMLELVFDALGVPSAVHDSVVQFEYKRGASVVPGHIAKCGELATLLGRMLRLEPLARPNAQAVLATAAALLAEKCASADTFDPGGLPTASDSMLAEDFAVANASHAKRKRKCLCAD